MGIFITDSQTGMFNFPFNSESLYRDKNSELNQKNSTRTLDNE